MIEIVNKKASAVKKRSSQPSPLSQPNIESVKIRSERLDVDFLVCVQDQTDNMVEQKIFCMTVHDLGTDCKITYILTNSSL